MKTTLNVFLMLWLAVSLPSCGEEDISPYDIDCLGRWQVSYFDQGPFLCDNKSLQNVVPSYGIIEDRAALKFTNVLHGGMTYQLAHAREEDAPNQMLPLGNDFNIQIRLRNIILDEGASVAIGFFPLLELPPAARTFADCIIVARLADGYYIGYEDAVGEFTWHPTFQALPNMDALDLDMTYNTGKLTGQQTIKSGGSIFTDDIPIITGESFRFNGVGFGIVSKAFEAYSAICEDYRTSFEIHDFVYDGNGEANTDLFTCLTTF
jgi:hypothetical protein